MAALELTPQSITMTDDHNHARAPRGQKFFEWIRTLGITRSDGWAGGVCAGIAYRIGIDPLIVRGIFVVVSILGAPALLFYALGWLLLPDRDNRIHLERLINGEHEPPAIAIAVLVVIALIPWNAAAWWGGWRWLSFWVITVISAGAAAVFLSTKKGTYRKKRPADSETDSDSTENAKTRLVDTTPEPKRPKRPGKDASDEEKAVWTTQFDQWQTAHDEWLQRRADDVRAVSAARAEENRERAIVARAQAEQRRATYRASHPVIPGAWGWGIVGVSIMVSALIGLWWGSYSSLPIYAPAAALATAALICVMAVIIAGILRRRGGALLFLGILLTLSSGLALALPPTVGTMTPTSSTKSDVATFHPSASAEFVLTGGTTRLDLTQALPRTESGTPTRISLVKAFGPTTMILPRNVPIQLDTVTTALLVADGGGGVSKPNNGLTRLGPPGRIMITIKVVQIGQLFIEWGK